MWLGKCRLWVGKGSLQPAAASQVHVQSMPASLGKNNQPFPLRCVVRLFGKLSEGIRTAPIVLCHRNQTRASCARQLMLT